LSGRANGKPLAWTNGSVKLGKSSETGASLEQVFENDRATLRINTSIEFDGYMIFDCTIKAGRDISMDNLTFDIPLQTRCATLCMGMDVLPENREIPMKKNYSGAVRGDLAFKFASSIWLGNEERGLCWQAESDEDWHYADEQKAIEILPRGDTTTFRAHLVDLPTRLAAGEELHYKFALLATPIKPMLRDSWDLRIARSDPFGEDLNLPDRKTNGEPTLQFYAKAGVRHLFSTAEGDPWPYPMPAGKEYSRGVRRMVEAVHHYGLRIYPYAIHERFPVAVPEFDINGLHIARFPLRAFQYGGAPPPPLYGGYHGPINMVQGSGYLQGTVSFCPKSKAAQDAWIHALARRLDEYGDDGVYLDGTGYIVPCRNRLHGCGYRGRDGKVHPTYPVFANREFMKRLYIMVKRRRPDGVLDVHHSFGMNIAALAFADMHWTGEHWWHLRKTKAKKGHIVDELPLDMFRAEFMGYPIGVATETLAYRLGSPIKVAAISLLHDIPVRARTQDKKWFRAMSKLWKMRDQFGAKEAERLFYWNNQDYVRVSPEKCYATLLKHRRNGVLAFVSNLSPDAQTLTVTLNMKKLGLRGKKLDVFNALTRSPVAMTADGKLSVKLGSEEWVYVWLRPTSGR